MTDSQRWFVFVLILIGLGLIYVLGPVLMPFLTAFLLAYFINPLVEKLRRLKVPRFVSALLVFLIVLLVFFTIILSVIPALETQIINFIHSIPAIIAWMQNTAIPWA